MQAGERHTITSDMSRKVCGAAGDLESLIAMQTVTETDSMMSIQMSSRSNMQVSRQYKPNLLRS